MREIYNLSKKYQTEKAIIIKRRTNSVNFSVYGGIVHLKLVLII